MPRTVGVGELLWDVFPGGRRPGGAPFNFAFHCRQLGHDGVIVSRVGTDEPGRALRAVLAAAGVPDDWVQADPERPTGRVTVRVDAHGQPAYAIAENVAWDFLSNDDSLDRLGVPAAVCFGTLAQRSAVACDTVRRLTSGGGLVVYDVNLRQHYYDASLIDESMARAAWVKLNADEMAVVGKTFAVDDPEAVRRRWPNVRRVVVTEGAAGCRVVTDDGEVREPAPAVDVVDTVGAGDAFTAALVCLELEGRPLRDAVRFALRYAADVCRHAGGTPRIDRAAVERSVG